jgi:hypothetical protein
MRSRPRRTTADAGDIVSYLTLAKNAEARLRQRGQDLPAIAPAAAQPRDPAVVPDRHSPTGSREAVTAVMPLTCFMCRGRRFWRSSYGPVICVRCHPPAAPHLVAAWIVDDTP